MGGLSLLHKSHKVICTSGSGGQRQAVGRGTSQRPPEHVWREVSFKWEKEDQLQSYIILLLDSFTMKWQEGQQFNNFALPLHIAKYSDFHQQLPDQEEYQGSKSLNWLDPHSVVDILFLELLFQLLLFLLKLKLLLLSLSHNHLMFQTSILGMEFFHRLKTTSIGSSESMLLTSRMYMLDICHLQNKSPITLIE